MLMLHKQALSYYTYLRTLSYSWLTIIQPTIVCVRVYLCEDRQLIQLQERIYYGTRYIYNND